ncbi:MAG: ATP-binding cassette domain-containing protein [Myxococcales bacterium]|nr:ATP-binding cassette domain-containing protein [Myxococcales bacterium]
MLSPTSGEVYLDGEPTSRLREAHRAEVRRRKVGFLFQDLQLIDALTALENVLLPEVPLHAVTRAREDRAMGLLRRFGVDHLAATPARSLSGGERQRVGSPAPALRSRLVLDEPTAHLDDARTRIRGRARRHEGRRPRHPRRQPRHARRLAPRGHSGPRAGRWRLDT